MESDNNCILKDHNWITLYWIDQIYQETHNYVELLNMPTTSYKCLMHNNAHNPHVNFGIWQPCKLNFNHVLVKKFNAIITAILYLKLLQIWKVCVCENVINYMFINRTHLTSDSFIMLTNPDMLPLCWLSTFISNKIQSSNTILQCNIRFR